jgi:hypothetical protein
MESCLSRVNIRKCLARGCSCGDDCVRVLQRHIGAPELEDYLKLQRKLRFRTLTWVHIYLAHEFVF